MSAPSTSVPSRSTPLRSVFCSAPSCKSSPRSVAPLRLLFVHLRKTHPLTPRCGASVRHSTHAPDRRVHYLRESLWQCDCTCFGAVESCCRLIHLCGRSRLALCDHWERWGIARCRCNARSRAHSREVDRRQLSYALRVHSARGNTAFDQGAHRWWLSAGNRYSLKRRHRSARVATVTRALYFGAPGGVGIPALRVWHGARKR